ncbi:MAG TPA: hypothetical protein VE988_04085 [Gemmataceae bacterium]|nr:hypothetical protein [Gemmataceae bacterium]
MSRKKATIIATAGFACVAIVVAIGLWLRLTHGQPENKTHQEALHAAEACGPCLPPGLSLAYEFSDSANPRRGITVQEKLVQLGAYCKNGVIYDRTGKTVVFYHIMEYGFTQHNAPQIYAKQRKEIEALQRENTVVLLYSAKPVQ